MQRKKLASNGEKVLESRRKYWREFENEKCLILLIWKVVHISYNVLICKSERLTYSITQSDMSVTVGTPTNFLINKPNSILIASCHVLDSEGIDAYDQMVSLGSLSDIHMLSSILCLFGVLITLDFGYWS